MKDLSLYTWEKEIAAYELDCENRLRPSSILRLMQESGDRQTAQEDIPYDTVVQRVCMVLISRSSVWVHRCPRAREELTMTTLQRAVRGVRMYRDFIFRVGDETVIEATNEYFCADLQTRRVIRPDIYLNSNFQMNQDFIPANPQPKRIVLPQEMIPAGERTIFDSFVDNNGHMNNSWYCDFAFDALPEELRRRPMKTLFTNYIHEALPGSTLSLFFAQQGDTVFVRGDLGEQTSFAVEIGF
jgi:Acyl-ACP thioesterase